MANYILLETVARGVFVHVRVEQLTGLSFGQSTQNVAQLFPGVRGIANGSGVVTALLDTVESVAMRRHYSTIALSI